MLIDRGKAREFLPSDILQPHRGDVLEVLE
jgi:hypothetical protein